MNAQEEVSRVAQIKKLKVGETFSIAYKPPRNKPFDIKEKLSSMSSAMSKAVSRAKSVENYTYMQEQLQALTFSGNVVLLILVTRTK